MLKTKVIADNILNLTDARYFAAYGVDYMVFNLAHISHADAKEISDWIEGVQIMLDINESLSPTILDFILKINPSGFISKDENVLSQIKEQLPSSEYYLRKDSRISSIDTKPKKTFINQMKEKVNLEEIIEGQAYEGIIVEGEAEEKVGFKNFDELDELFDQLMIEN